MSKNIALERVWLPPCCITWTYTHTCRFSHANATDVHALNKIRCNDSIYKYLASNEHGIQRFKLVSPMHTVSREPLFALTGENKWHHRGNIREGTIEKYIFEIFELFFKGLFKIIRILWNHLFLYFLDYFYIFC